MSDFKNELSFSASAAKMLNRCALLYWRQKYGSWGGWWSRGQPPTSDEARDMYEAKHSDNLPSLAGGIVHNVAKRYLVMAMEGKQWERETLRNAMLQSAAVEVDRAMKQATRKPWRGNPKKVTRLVEVECGEKLDEEWLRERIRTRILALTSLDDAWSNGKNVFLSLVSRPKLLYTVEDLLRDDVHGITAYMMIDASIRSASGGVIIIDWKTGARRDEDLRQIAQYAAWAQSQGWESIRVLLVYLGDGKTDVVEPPDIDIPAMVAEAHADVKNYLDNVRPRLVNGDLSLNRPIEGAFPATTDPDDCNLCTYRHICEREGTKPRRLD